MILWRAIFYSAICNRTTFFFIFRVHNRKCIMRTETLAQVNIIGKYLYIDRYTVKCVQALQRIPTLNYAFTESQFERQRGERRCKESLVGFIWFCNNATVQLYWFLCASEPVKSNHFIFFLFLPHWYLKHFMEKRRSVYGTTIRYFSSSLPVKRNANTET